MLHLMHTRDQNRELRPVPPGHTVHPVLIWSSVLECGSRSWALGTGVPAGRLAPAGTGHSGEINNASLI